MHIFYWQYDASQQRVEIKASERLMQHAFTIH